MHLGLKNIYVNIRESIFLKIWIHFNLFQSILVYWVLWMSWKNSKEATAEEKRAAKEKEE